MSAALTGRHPASDFELKKDFVLADRDRDRVINFDEFLTLLRELEAEMSMEDMRVGFESVDTNHDGVIDIGEFIEWWTSD
ncbi:MAG: EF-hand domain-containing protein [Steroidobacteraceae bacterium]